MNYWIRLRIYFFLVFYSLFIPAQTSFIHAQSTGKVTGIILERGSGSPVAFANIIVSGTTLGASSKLDGSFTINRIPAGIRTITVYVIGFSPLSKEVNVEPGKTVVTQFELDESVLSSEELVITSEMPVSAASSKIIQAMDFELRPRISSQDLLRLAPGLVIAQHAGGGKAEQIYIRGFDCDHGTDINISVDGIPVNMVSHGHGQGYADLHFIMPEVLRGIEVYKGPYFAQYGDFGTAGTIRFNTIDEVEKTSLRAEGGSYGLFRAVALAPIKLESDMTTAYVAGEFMRNESYFDQSQNFRRYNLFGKTVTHFDAHRSLSVWASGFLSHWDASGQIPERAVKQGIIGRFGAIDPSEGGETERHNLNVQYTQTGSNAYFFAQSYISRYRFRLFSNFTLFKEDPINGDEIEQGDRRWITGGRMEYNLNETFGSQRIKTMFGSSVRHDNIENELWHNVNRRRLESKAVADIRQTNLAFYAQQDYRIFPRVQLQLGLRNDNFFFDVNDKLHKGQPEDISGEAHQSIFSPKANLTVSPTEHLNLFLNFGMGFHSNDARGILAMQSARSLPRAVGSEIGTKYSTARSTTTLAFWGLDLEGELVYVGDEGTTEESGPTRRIGIDFSTRFQVLSWLWADADVSVSRGRFKNLPEGQNYIPLAPTVTSTGGLTMQHNNRIEGNLRYRYVDSRPANEDNTVRALGSTVFDAGISYRWNRYKFSIIAENLFNVKWNEAQFDTESRLPGEAEPVSELHFTPGTPFSVRAKIEFAF